LVAEKRFREDLFFRLNVVPIRVPPLHERKEDIPILTRHFIDKFVDEFSLPTKTLASDALELLQNHSWPGNVRELENVIKRSMVLTGGAVIKAKELKNILSENPAIFKTESLEELSLEEILRNKLTRFLEKFDRLEAMDLYETVLHMVERPLISLVLKKTGGNQIQAARVLGINRNTLRKMIRTLKIPVERSPEEDP
jgi:two-component system nitrogen regulation response regulator GlnG